MILMSLLLTLNTFHTLFYCFYCEFWTSNCRLRINCKENYTIISWTFFSFQWYSDIRHSFFKRINNAIFDTHLSFSVKRSWHESMHRYFNERLLILMEKPFGDWFWIPLLNKFLKKQLGIDHLNQIVRNKWKVKQICWPEWQTERYKKIHIHMYQIAKNSRPEFLNTLH